MLSKVLRVFSGIFHQNGAILVHEGPNLGMQILLGKQAHPTNLICAGDLSGICVDVFHESQKIRVQIMLNSEFFSPFFSLIIIARGHNHHRAVIVMNNKIPCLAQIANCKVGVHSG